MSPQRITFAGRGIAHARAERCQGHYWDLWENRIQDTAASWTCGLFFNVRSQRRRGYWQHVSNERCSVLERRLSLGSSGIVPQHVQDRHHVVSVRRAALLDEVRIVDLRQFRHQSAAAGGERRHVKLHHQRGMASDRFVAQNLLIYNVFIASIDGRLVQMK